ncbi:MAG: competence protein ComEA [Frankiaceae bacterium]|jgi:competence protein ComEA|nr:competence protein ComEA [Frankiaceae bacterium]
MRGDDDGLGTAADRLPLGGGERLTVGGWVPGQPDVLPPAPPGRLPLWAQPWLQPAAARHLGWVVAAAVVLLAGSAWMLLHRPAPRPVPAAATAATPAPVPELQIVVDVGGRVRHPGLVTLAPGSRVADALRAAGGALRSADIATVDLAARVSDGQLLLIGVPQPVAAGGDASAPVSLSSATVDQLDALPGIGPVLAKRIVDWREAHGGFTSLSQLEQVPGVGPRTYERLKSLVVL